jgi:hypothetical protein
MFIVRHVAAAALAPVATTCLAEVAFFAYVGEAPRGEELRLALYLGLATGFFVALVNFLPLYLVARRFIRLNFWIATLLGALAGWIAPFTYMLLMAVWRGEALNAWVIGFTENALSPWLAAFGALGGVIFWAIARNQETAPRHARAAQRAASIGVPAPLSGLSGS